MIKLKRIHKILIVMLVASICCLAFVYAQMFNNYMDVYDVDGKYTQSSFNANLEIVNFSNIGCQICTKLHPVLKEAIEADGAIKYIPRPVAYGSGIETTSVYSIYAASRQGKFIEMYNAIFDNWPIENEKQLLNIAAQLGIDTKQLNHDMSDNEIRNQVEENNHFFEKWGTGRFPTLLIGRKRLYTPTEEEMPTIEILLDKFNKSRK